MLCPECHYARHNTWMAKQVQEKCVKHLRELYGEKGARRD